MASLIPISTYNLALKPFNPVQAIADDYPVTIRITLAAVDPEAVDDKAEPSTLRILKGSNPLFDDYDDEFDDEDDEDEDEDDEDDLDELDDEEVKVEELKDDEAEEAEEDEEDDEEKEDDDEEDEDDEDDEDDDEEDDGISEYIICTLSPKVQFQQTLDITISPDEEVYFVATGSYPIHLSGNYVEHPDDEDEDDYYNDDDEDDYDEDDDEYNLTPDDDELVDGEDYDLEDLENEEDVEAKLEELINNEIAKKGKKRSVEEIEEDDEEEAEEDSKKSKKEKSVQFTEELEQGPTGSSLTEKKETKKERKQRQKAEKAAAAAAAESESKEEKDSKKEESSSKKYPTKTLLGGVVTEDRKVGKGTTAKSGNKVGIRYIGKLKNGKVFDKNTNGKPFSFNLGKGECIKGFDLGVAGMAIGGERRVIIPAKMGYGSQALPGIPANSELTFDIKLVTLK